MWCSYLQKEMNCQVCDNSCTYLQNCGHWQLDPQYNYKCPDCHGEFNQPNGTLNGWNCPFCNKKMEGLY